MREVTYIDETRLVAVDHPSEMELLTNDKFKEPAVSGVSVVRSEAALLPENGA